MDYLSLTDTDFFKQIDISNDNQDLHESYYSFIKTISDLCTESENRYELFLSLTYTQIELQSIYKQSYSGKEPNMKSSKLHHIDKALIFIQGILDHMHNLDFSSKIHDKKESTPISSKFRWTGSTVELVELIYGLTEMNSLNNGELSITELSHFISSGLNVEIKDCYSAYIDIKRRKNNSRTYFLDKMKDRLNRRMDNDDEKDKNR